MVYVRRAKNLIKLIHDINVSQAQHTWEYADSRRLSQVGSAAQGSFAERRRRELHRNRIGAYNQSRIATSHVQARREISEFSKKERAKSEKSYQDSTGQTHSPKLSERPIPNQPLFRRPGL